MAITARQRLDRAFRVGSSDAPRIMAGDWKALWLEKTGRTAPADLDYVPAVQIGIVTEPLHARFWQRRTGIGCVPGGRTWTHPEHDWMVAHPDYLTWRDPPADPAMPPDTVLEAKFNGGFQTDEDLVERYWWQVQHQLLVTGLPHGALSILRPGAYTTVDVPRDDAGIDVLRETLSAFWWHVANDVEPAAGPLAVEAPAVERARVLDMALHNAFASLSGVLAANRGAVDAYRGAEKEIKALIPDDCRTAFARVDGATVLVTRSRDGRVSLRFAEPPRRDRDRAETWLPDTAPVGADF